MELPGRCGDWARHRHRPPPRGSLHGRHEQRVGTFTWPPAGTSPGHQWGHCHGHGHRPKSLHELSAAGCLDVAMTAQQVDSSTVSAAGLFANSTFVVPDFQRRYSWSHDIEVETFWQDLVGALNAGTDYFLGLLILTEDGEEREIVDGQQRLLTLSLLANSLRLAAISLDRKLVAETLQNTFLFSVNYRTEALLPRIRLSDPTDSIDYQKLISAPTAALLPPAGDSPLIAAHDYLAKRLAEDLANARNPALRLGKWAEFISHGLIFTVFTHPSRAAAFRVFEVVNTRGKALTPAQLIKSYLIGMSEDRESTVTRWRAIEEQFEDLGADEELTTFVRHVAELRLGYIVPRELYDAVTKAYPGQSGVEDLLSELETHLPTYTQFIDPTVDVESSEVRTRVFTLLSHLSAGRFRPLFLAAAATGEDSLLEKSLTLISAGVLAGTFGTGGIEAQFARAARRVHSGETSWSDALTALGELRPMKEEFELRLQRNVNKVHALILRTAMIQGSTIPRLAGHAHQVRPRNGIHWDGFTDEDYKEVGGTLGNWVVVTIERRPPGSRTPSGVREKLLPHLAPGESLEPEALTRWTPAAVDDRTRICVKACVELWYGRE